MENKSIRTEKIIFLGSVPITTTTSTTSSTTTGLPPAPTTTSTTTGTTTSTTTTISPVLCCSNFATGPFRIFTGAGSECIFSNFYINDTIRFTNTGCKLYVWAKYNAYSTGDFVVHFWEEIHGIPSSFFDLGFTYKIHLLNHTPVYSIYGNPVPQTLIITYDSGLPLGSCNWNGIYDEDSDWQSGSYIYCP